MRSLVLATQNQKKRKELEELTRDKYLVRTLADVGLADLEIDEPGATFAENARIKAEVVAGLLPDGVKRETFAVIADDSGIAVDILDGKPGVRSARFAADHGVGEGDAANNALLLLLLEAVPDVMRAARFVSAVCAVITDTGELVTDFGTVEGTIAHDQRGGGGFGYDPLFLPNETPGRRMAELTSDEKHAISHRGRAMRSLLAKLARVESQPPSSSSSQAAAFVFKRARPR